MQINEKNFKKISNFLNQSGMKTAEIAKYFSISERAVQRIKEAGTWERWPYIQAKARYGYQTPEYKAHLKRKGLPLTPPAKAKPAKKRVRKAPEVGKRGTLESFKLFYEDLKTKIKRGRK